MGWTESLRRFFGLPGARGVTGALGELVLWWAGGTVFWLATASTVTVSETLVAAAVALAGAVLARLARRAIPFDAKPRLAWLGWAALVPVAAAADSLRLAGWLKGRQLDGIVEEQLPASDRREETGWRAGAIVALSATAGSVVVDADPRTGKATVHSLATGWPHLDKKVSVRPDPHRRRSGA